MIADRACQITALGEKIEVLKNELKDEKFALIEETGKLAKSYTVVQEKNVEIDSLEGDLQSQRSLVEALLRQIKDLEAQLNDKNDQLNKKVQQPKMRQTGDVSVAMATTPNANVEKKSKGTQYKDPVKKKEK